MISEPLKRSSYCGFRGMFS